MIKPDELMTGNYVFDSSTIYKVALIQTSDYGVYDNGDPDKIIAEDLENDINQHYYEYSYEDLQGIPITEELLVRLGFEHMGDSSMYYKNLQILEAEGGYMYTRDGYHADGIVIKYIHQLQLLYKALTGEQLKFIK